MWPPLNGTQQAHGLHVGLQTRRPPAIQAQHIFVPTLMATFDTVSSAHRTMRHSGECG